MKQLLIVLIGISSLYLSYRNIGKQDGQADAGPRAIEGAMIDEGQSILKDGDLVVRLNRDPSSQFIRHFNRHDKSYSHSGIVLYENGYPYVYHIVNGSENPDEKLRRDSLSHFCNPRKNSAFGIFRYNISTAEIERLRKTVHNWYGKEIRFDTKFNLETDDRMYCSEFVSKALAEATGKRISIEATKLSTVESTIFSAYTHLSLAYTGKLGIIAIDALYTNPFCHLVKAYQYEKNK